MFTTTDLPNNAPPLQRPAEETLGAVGVRGALGGAGDEGDGGREEQGQE